MLNLSFNAKRCKACASAVCDAWRALLLHRVREGMAVTLTPQPSPNYFESTYEPELNLRRTNGAPARAVATSTRVAGSGVGVLWAIPKLSRSKVSATPLL